MKTLNPEKAKLPRKFLIGLALVPAASVIAMCGLLLLAHNFPDGEVATEDQPLTKTSWQAGNK